VSKKPRARWVAPVFGSLVVLLGVAGVGAGLVAIKAYQFQQMSAQGAPPESPSFVRLAQAKPIAFRQTSTAIGTVIAPRSIVLSNEVAGTVTRTNLSAGSIVEAGTVLLQLDTSIEIAQFDAAQAAAKMSRSRFARTKEAYRTKALTELELEEAEGQLNQTEARVAELKAVIAKKTLTAPFKARVGLSDTHEGQYLPSGTVITSLQSVDEYMFVDFTLPQSVAHSIEIGQPVRVTTDKQTYSASMEALDSRTDKLTRNVMARARLSMAPDSVKPGDSVKVFVEYGPEVRAIAIPAEAVRRSPTGSQVFVASQDDKGQLRAHQKTVQVIHTVGDSAALLGGIESGETVVAAGSFKLLDGNLLTEGDPEATPTMTQASQTNQ
jgi:membrane fusion protein, multidrug efflux system